MSIEVGSKLEGKVTGITHFGAFVELPGGVTGLVHISEVDDEYVKDINQFLKINDRVKVKVLHVDKNGKIGLSIRQAKNRPAPDPETRKAMDRAFEDKLNRFLKDSEERLSTLRRATESKRGGRGTRRSF
jgi:S1 RNA binding domain protein